MKGFTIRNEWETLQAIVSASSCGRFGDGEEKLMRGQSAKSQEYDKRLASIMRAFIREPGKVLCGVPTFDRNGPKWHSFWKHYEPRFRAVMNPSVVYYSSLITRPDSAPNIDSPLYWDTMRSIWSGKDVMLVRGSGKSLTAERLPEASAVQEVLCPVRHAFSEYDNLRALIKREHAGRPVILCCGATATALAYELGNEGIYCIDLGHAGLTIGRREGQFNTEGNNG